MASSAVEARHAKPRKPPAWQYRRSTLSVPEWTLDLGLSRRMFWLIIGAGHHRIVIDYHNVRRSL